MLIQDSGFDFRSFMPYIFHAFQSGYGDYLRLADLLPRGLLLRFFPKHTKPWRINEEVSISVRCNCTCCRRLLAKTCGEHSPRLVFAGREDFAGPNPGQYREESPANE